MECPRRSTSRKAAGRPLKLQSIAADAVNWRRHLHMQPEIGFDVPDTTRFIAGRLHSFALNQVDVDVGGGVVGVFERASKGAIWDTCATRRDGRVANTRTQPVRSRLHKRRPHACMRPQRSYGDARRGSFSFQASRRVCCIAFVFQPAEEGDAGARAMLEHGLVERYDITCAIAPHNRPGMHAGALALLPGPVMATADRITFPINASDWHAAMPKCPI